MSEELSYFKETYAENRADFRLLHETIRSRWPAAEVDRFPVAEAAGGGDDLTIDLIKALPQSGSPRLLFLTTGLHGIEGYIGAAVLKLFVKEYLPLLNPENTGLYLVHAINPWGMKHRRRVNENNVDLNRNFTFELDSANQEVNPAYDRANTLLNPNRPLRSTAGLFFYPGLIHRILHMGPANFKQVVLYGQYRYPQGLYYGGAGFEHSAKVIDRLFKEAAQAAEKFLLLDMHSGYGPRYQMMIVNSRYEKRASADLKQVFAYPLVAKADPAEFYQMQGDMIDYFYRVMEEYFPGKYFYGTSFEFGTYGSTFSAAIRSLKALINENRLFHCGSGGEKARQLALREFDELFIPREPQWRAKALQDARLAFAGILKAEKFLD